MEPRIQFCTAPDGANLAYAITGNGPPLVRAAHYLSHLQFDSDSPVWNHWIRELSRTHTYIRYDERGCGLSDWNPPGFSFDLWVDDLETVVDSLGLERFDLLGVSQGGPVGIAYAVRHPERVRRLILYGTYARGANKGRAGLDPAAKEIKAAMHRMILIGWGQDNPAFRQLFTSHFIPEGGPEQLRWFNELQRVSCSPENAARFDDVFAEIDVSGLLPKVRVQTLVMHARGDLAVPFDEGRWLASRIPGARFVPFEGRNHILLENDPGWRTFLAELNEGDRGSPHTDLEFATGRPPIRTAGHDAGLRSAIVSLNEVALSRYSVVGNYVRHETRSRNLLKDWKQRVATALSQPQSLPANFLIWAPPGSGKTYFVREIAGSLRTSASYLELNLGGLAETEFRSGLAGLTNRTTSALCLVDEVDARPKETWPYELLLPALEVPSDRGSVAHVLAGSTTSGIEEMKRRIASRPKGPDLLSRIPNSNELAIPPMSDPDQILLTLAQVRDSGVRSGAEIMEVEKLAVYFVCTQAHLRNARQLRDFADQALGRLGPGEDRLRFDHLFAPGDPQNKEFWTRNSAERTGLEGEYIHLSA